MNIEVGEYIRTKNGEIAIFRGYNERKASQWIYKLEFQKRKSPKYCAEGYIVKHSKNIIDLIEVGDVVKTGVNKSFLHILATRKDLEHFKKVYKNDQDLIKSIVTKQQFSNVEYRL
jgi:hypothetical protein